MSLPKLTLTILMTVLVLSESRAASEYHSSVDPVRANIAIANVLFASMHELGHAIIDEFELPLLGGEEEAADTLAVLIVTHARKQRTGPGAPTYTGLAAAIRGQQLIWESGVEKDNLEQFFWTSHKLSIQRYYDLVCLFYGSEPDTLHFLPELSGLSEERAFYCDDDYERAYRSAAVLAEWTRTTYPDRIANNTQFPINITPAQDPGLASMISRVGEQVLPTVLESLQKVMTMPKNMIIEIKPCEYPNAFWDPEEDVMTLCHELITSLYELAAEVKIPQQIRDLDDLPAHQ